MISVVVPCFNEEAGLPKFWERLSAVLIANPTHTYEVVFVDDGSRDQTLDVINSIIRKSSTELGNSKIQIKSISLSRNFGHQAALMAGLARSRGDAVISIDADLQDPPELIPALIEEWAKGFDIVYAKRISRQDSFLKKISAFFFYRFVRFLSKTDLEMDTADFRLASRRAVNVVVEMSDQDPYLRGIFSWIGFSKSFVEYKRDSRIIGDSGYSISKMLKLASDGIFHFSSSGTKIPLFLGLIAFITSIIFAIWVFVGKLLDPQNSVPGYTTIVLFLLTSFGIQMLTLGIISEYVFRSFTHSRARPTYIIKEERKCFDE